MLYKQISIGVYLSLCSILMQAQRPKDFVNLREKIPDLVVSLRYGTPNNFMGRVVKGYEHPEPWATEQLATALQCAQAHLEQKGLGLILYDSYRPQKAVDHFMAWADNPTDTLNKTEYYPEHPKDQLFALGFIASKSGHSRGSSVDVGLIRQKSDSGFEVLDMGSPWDFFGDAAGLDFSGLTQKQRYNRMQLQKTMIECGCKPYKKEWWHFTIKREPYPNTYFNFSMLP